MGALVLFLLVWGVFLFVVAASCFEKGNCQTERALGFVLAIVSLVLIPTAIVTLVIVYEGVKL
jgi:hypothetical protein